MGEETFFDPDQCRATARVADCEHGIRETVCPTNAEMEAGSMDIAHFHRRLVARKEELQRLLVRLEDTLDDPKSRDFSEHATESEFDEVYESQGREGLKEISAIDAAIDRIANESFGICASCGNEISQERLDAVPHAAMCRNCMQ